MAKYDPLERHLRRQRAPTYEMTFRDIERVLKALLPRRAQQPAWWNNDGSPADLQCRAWLAAGYRAVLLSGEQVRFERTGPDPARSVRPVAAPRGAATDQDAS